METAVVLSIKLHLYYVFLPASSAFIYEFLFLKASGLVGVSCELKDFRRKLGNMVLVAGGCAGCVPRKS